MRWGKIMTHFIYGADSYQEPLTRRESEVLYWVGQGMSNPEIANRLSISIATVRTYVNILYEKLHIEGQFVRGKLIRYAADVEALSAKILNPS